MKSKTGRGRNNRQKEPARNPFDRVTPSLDQNAKMGSIREKEGMSGVLAKKNEETKGKGDAILLKKTEKPGNLRRCPFIFLNGMI
jgi:hypothetical protein